VQVDLRPRRCLRFPLATTTLAFRLGVLLPLFRLLPQLTLTFDACQPRSNRRHSGSGSSVDSRPRREHTATAVAVTSPLRKPAGARRGSRETIS